MPNTPAPLANLLRAVIPRTIRNALRRPGASLRQLFQRWNYARGKVEEVRILPGWTVRCHPICVDEFGVFQRDAEQELEMQCFARLSAPGMHFLDVGTHWGVFTLAALHFGGGEVRVMGIEASDAAARVYRENLVLNSAGDRVTLINAACGDRVGELKMLTTGAGSADYFVHADENRPDTITVPQVSIDHAVSTRGFVPSHLKIDVEGFEEEVLVGARNTLTTHRPILFLELHGDFIRQRHRRPEAVLDLLKSMNYGCWQRLDGGPLDFESLERKQFNVRFVAMAQPQ